mmetsp:Transcript_6599/g.15137  ORF Transcript_6599/g.15137 Transcript_6599/m.15137 type:complete len:82 (+) Transcript_6599:359-604(+)
MYTPDSAPWGNSPKAPASASAWPPETADTPTNESTLLALCWLDERQAKPRPDHADGPRAIETPHRSFPGASGGGAYAGLAS